MQDVTSKRGTLWGCSSLTTKNDVLNPATGVSTLKGWAKTLLTSTGVVVALCLLTTPEAAVASECSITSTVYQSADGTTYLMYRNEATNSSGANSAYLTQLVMAEDNVVFNYANFSGYGYSGIVWNPSATSSYQIRGQSNIHSRNNISWNPAGSGEFTFDDGSNLSATFQLNGDPNYPLRDIDWTLASSTGVNTPDSTLTTYTTPHPSTLAGATYSFNLDADYYAYGFNLGAKPSPSIGVGLPNAVPADMDGIRLDAGEAVTFLLAPRRYWPVYIGAHTFCATNGSFTGTSRNSNFFPAACGGTKLSSPEIPVTASAC